MHQIGDHVEYYDPAYRQSSCNPIIVTYIHPDGKLELTDVNNQYYIDQEPSQWILTWRPAPYPAPPDFSFDIPEKKEVIKKPKSKYCKYVDPFYLPEECPKIPDNGKIPTSKIREWVCTNYREWPRCPVHDKSLDLKYAQGENHKYGKHVQGYFYCLSCNSQRKRDERDSQGGLF